MSNRVYKPVSKEVTLKYTMGCVMEELYSLKTTCLGLLHFIKSNLSQLVSSQPRPPTVRTEMVFTL